MSEVNWENRTLFQGDNLDIMRGMNSNSVHLIATDPPFQKGMVFDAKEGSAASGESFDDRWSWGEMGCDELMDEMGKAHHEVCCVVDLAQAAHSRPMSAFICWLGVRMIEMHRVLRNDGSIYVHIDHTSHAYVKVLMDAIFGRSNHKNDIVWYYRKWTNNARSFQRNHDILLFYTKSNEYTFNKQYHDDLPLHKMKGYTSNVVQGGRRQLIIYDKHKPGSQRELSKVVDGKYDTVIYQEGNQGTVISSVWDVSILSSGAKERTGYPTQKPVSLYDRIVRASSNEGDIVFDPFYGSGTTLEAAEREGRRWVGIDKHPQAKEYIMQRFERLHLNMADKSEKWQPSLVSWGDVHFEQTPPLRTDLI